MSALDQNIEKLNIHLAQFKDRGILHRIAGEDIAGGGGSFATISPVDKSTICEVARDMPTKKRKAILIRIAEGIKAWA